MSIRVATPKLPHAYTVDQAVIYDGGTRLRIKTPLLYTDTSNIDVYLIAEYNAGVLTYKVSDLSVTDTYCFHAGLIYNKRIAESYGLKIENSEMFLTIPLGDASIIPYVVTLATAIHAMVHEAKVQA